DRECLRPRALDRRVRLPRWRLLVVLERIVQLRGLPRPPAGGPGLGKYVNCSDCATIVSTFANAVGCDLWQSRMGYGFGLNPLLAIGFNVWQTACGWGSFSYHEVAWKDGCTANDPVWDACLQV